MSEFTIEQISAITKYRQIHNLGNNISNESVLSIMQKEMGDKIGEIYPCFKSLNAEKSDVKFTKFPFFNFGINSSKPIQGVQLEKNSSPKKSIESQNYTVELSKEQAENLTIEYLSENIQSSISILKRQDGGLVTDGYDSLKEAFDKELSQKNVGEVLNNEISGLGYFQKAQSNSLSKKEYYQENKLRLKEMILKRVYEKDEKSGIDFIDRNKGSLSRKEFEGFVEKVIQNRIDSIPTMQGIKDMQHALVMMNDAEKTDFLNKLSQNAKKELKKPVPIESKGDILPQATVKNDYDTTEPMTFEEVYKLERGVEFSKDLMENLAQKKGELNIATGAYNKYNQFVTSAEEILEDYKKSTAPITNPDGSSYIPNEPSAEDRKNQLINLYQNYYSASHEKNADKKNLEIAIKKSGLPILVRQNYEGQIDLDLSAFKTDSEKNRAINKILRVGMKEQKSNLDKILNGKNIETYIKDYEKANQVAMGSENMEELAKAMEEDNYTAINKYTGMGSMAGMGLMVIGGVTCIAPLVALGGTIAMSGIAAKNTLGFTEALSRNSINSEELKELGKSLAMDIGGFAVGGYAGKKGLEVAKNLLSKGSSPWIAMAAEKTTDFSLSLAGDLAMMGVLHSSDTAEGLTQGNLMGILVSTFTGIKASKEMFKNAQLKPQAALAATDAGEIKIKLDEKPQQYNAVESDVPVSSNPKPELSTEKLSERLKNIAKDDLDLNNYQFRSVLDILKSNPEKAEFILSNLEKAKSGKDSIINFILSNDYDPKLEQSDILIDFMSKYGCLRYGSEEKLMQKDPEYLRGILNFVRSYQNEDGNYPLMSSVEILADSDIKDFDSLKPFVEPLIMWGRLDEERFIKVVELSENQRQVISDFISIYSKAKENYQIKNNNTNYNFSRKIYVEDVLKLLKFDSDKISALKNIYEIGTEENYPTYDFKYLEKLYDCSIEQIREIEKFAKITANGTYQYKSLETFESFAKCSAEKLQKIYGMTEIRDTKNKPLYSSYTISEFLKYPDEKINYLIEFAKIKTEDKWLNEEVSQYQNIFDKLVKTENEKLDLLLQLAKIEKDGKMYFDNSTYVENLLSQSTEKIAEIKEYYDKNPEISPLELVELKSKTYNQLIMMNGKNVDHSNKNELQIKLEKDFENALQNSKLNADLIYNACLDKDNNLDEGAVKIFTDILSEHQDSYYDDNDFVLNVLNSFKNEDGKIDFESYKEIKSLVDSYKDKFTSVHDYNDYHSAMYSFAKNKGASALKDVQNAMDYMLYLNDIDLKKTGYNILKNSDADFDMFKTIMDKCQSNIYSNKFSRYDLNKMIELSTSKESNLISSEKFKNLVELSDEFEFSCTYSDLIHKTKPELIDDEGRFFEFIKTVKNMYDSENSFNRFINFHYIENPIRQMDLDCLDKIKAVYDKNSNELNDLSDVIENLNENNVTVLNTILEKYNGKSSLKLGNIEIEPDENKFSLNNVANILRDIHTKDDAEFISLLLDKGVGVSKSYYGKGLNFKGTKEIRNFAHKCPQTMKLLKATQSEDLMRLFLDDYNNEALEKYLSELTDEQQVFLTEIFFSKNSFDDLVLRFRELENGLIGKFKKIPPEKYDNVRFLSQKIADKALIFDMSANATPKEIEKFLKLSNVIQDEILNRKIYNIVKSEKTFNNKDLYDELINSILDGSSEFSLESIEKILSYPYNKKSFDYIKKSLCEDNFISQEALINYIIADPKNIDNLEYLKTSKNMLATPEVLEYLFKGGNKTEITLFNEMVNELKTNNDTNSYSIDVLFKNARRNELNSEEQKTFSKLYRFYDENGKHRISDTIIFDLAKNQELAAKALNEKPSQVKKIDLNKVEITQEQIKELAQNMPNEFKALLYNFDGKFGEKEYKDLLTKLNENEYLRDALKDYEKDGKIDLSIFENKDLALSLINNDPAVLGLIHNSPELIQNNPASVKQNINKIGEIIDFCLNKMKDYARTNPGVLPPSMDLDSFINECKKFCYSEENSAMYLNLLNIFGAKNIKSFVENSSEKNIMNVIYDLEKYTKSELAPTFSKLFEIENITEKEFDLIMKVAEYVELKNSKGHYYGDNNVKLVQEDFEKMIEKIIQKGKFDKNEFFEDIYKGFLDANINDFEPMTSEQIKIIAEQDFIGNKNIEPQQWQKFVSLDPQVREVAGNLVKTHSFNDIMNIINLAQNKDDILSGMSFKDKMKMLDVIDSFTKEDLEMLRRTNYDIDGAITKIVKALNIEKKFIETDPQKQKDFVNNFIGNNNKSSENLIKNTDFTTSEFSEGIPLKYPRTEFFSDMEKILDTLYAAEKQNVMKYFDIYKSENGYEGIPVIPKDSNIALSNPEKIAAEKISSLIDKFTTKNESLVKDPELKKMLDAIVQGFPEFTSIIGKKQHDTHSYTVDIHTLKVLQYAMNDPAYQKLSDKDKTILKLTALVHDFGKKEGVVDEGHAELSSEYVNGILAKFDLPDSVKYRIVELVNNHHWFAAYNKGEMSSDMMATLCRNPEDFEISKILAKADLLGVSDSFYLSITNTSDREEFDAFLADKFSYIDKQLLELRSKANIILDNKILNNGKKFPIQKVNLDGQEVELKVLNLTDKNIDNLAQYGFAPGTTKDNLRLTVHMTPDFSFDDNITSASAMNTFNILSATPTHHSVQSTSLISYNNNRTYAYRKFGFILDVDQANISTANYGNVGSGRNKTLQAFAERLFSNERDRSWVKTQFVNALKRKNIEINEQDYATLAKFLYTKKHSTQIYSEFVNEKASPEMISENSGFTKELYAEYISPKTSPERKSEIFDLCVGSKTYVIKKDGSISVEYDSKINSNRQDDGNLRIKAKDLRDALESSRDMLFKGPEHSEIVSLTPRINGLVARVSNIQECPKYFLQYAKEHNLPIILIGFKDPSNK